MRSSLRHALFDAKGFRRTTEFLAAQAAKRTVAFTLSGVDDDADIYWIDAETSKQQLVGTLAGDNARHVLNTHVGHHFLVQDSFGDTLGEFTISASQTEYVVSTRRAAAGRSEF